MTQSSSSPRALGLSFLAALGLMAFMAIEAQASEKSWLISGADITSNQRVLLHIHTELNLKVKEETNLEILCKIIIGGFPISPTLIAGTTEGSGQVNFEACKTWQGGKESVNCKPFQPVLSNGKARLILHESKNYLLIEPTTKGGKLAVIEFKPPCALPESNNVKGSLVLECLKESNLAAIDCKQEETWHLFKQANAALFSGDALLYGTKAAVLEGIAKSILEIGSSWAGHV